MHYAGMQAMSVSGHIRWNEVLVIASIAAGIGLTAAAMWCFKVQDSKLLAAGLFTVAVCTLHFTAMAAATVEFDPGNRELHADRQQPFGHGHRRLHIAGPSFRSDGSSYKPRHRWRAETPCRSRSSHWIAEQRLHQQDD